MLCSQSIDTNHNYIYILDLEQVQLFRAAKTIQNAFRQYKVCDYHGHMNITYV